MQVVEEAKRLAASGYREIVLTGIHLSSYGRSSYEKLTEEGGQPLLLLISQLNEVEGIQRIRLGSLEPRIITENFVKTLCACEKVCPQFHLSLQSGSDTVLKRMNRKYTTEEYASCVEVLRNYYENPAITTDIIVGFPQETEEEFKETLEFAKRIGFSKIHVFKYSRRKGTAADRMSGQIEERVKTKRSERLMELETALGEAYRGQFLGKGQKVLFEEGTVIDGEICQVGYNERYVRIAVKTTEDLSNCIKSVKIVGKAKEQETLMAEF